MVSRKKMIVANPKNRTPAVAGQVGDFHQVVSMRQLTFQALDCHVVVMAQNG